MKDVLALFYANETQREAVKEYLIFTLGEMAKQNAFNGDKTDHIKDARLAIEQMFDKLEETYGIIKTPEISNSR